jgi:serine/threonine-protein kinase
VNVALGPSTLPGARAGAHADPRIGLALDDRYTLLEWLGAGGMGVVYKARHRYTGELVAIKLWAADLPAGASRDEIRRRFLSEPRLQSLARHPHVLRVIDAGVAGLQPYLVTDFVDGEDLQDRLDGRGVLPIAETLAILGPAAAALDAAHERGVVHRDVKPANVLIRRDGHVFLTDFGVAKDPAGVDATAMFVGTTLYAAPEQITLASVVDQRADVYALASVMFHCLTGRPPFQGDSPYEVMTRHVTEPPPAVSRAGRDVSAALDPVLARGLAKAPADRHATCGELIAEAAAATDIDIASVTAPAPCRPTSDPAEATTAVLNARVSARTFSYATESFPEHPPTVAAAPVVRAEMSKMPTAARPKAPRRRGARTALLAGGVLATLLAVLVMAPSTGRDRDAGSPPASGHNGEGSAATGSGAEQAGFTGYAAQLATDFPGHIVRHGCRQEPDLDNPDALALIHCTIRGGQIDTYYELWPNDATMNQLLDDNSSGLNVYFAGYWTDGSSKQQGRVDRFVTGLLDPHNVILWSYEAINATIWAQSGLSEDQLLAWWRKSAPPAPSQSHI